jgi:dienelactone hydrolase
MVVMNGSEDSAEYAKHFNYERSAPLKVEQAGSQQRGHVTVEDLSYAGAEGQRVPAYLVIPAGKGPFAAILWGHWMMPASPYMNRKEFLDEAVALAPSGVVSLLIDAPMVRAGAKNQDNAESYVKSFQQDVIDLRRGLDLLLAREDVDGNRVAYVGHSFHAGTGGVLAGVDSRPQAFVLMAGNMDASRILVSQAREAVEVRQQMGEAALKQFLAATPWMNPASYLGQGRKHAPLFLQFGTHDAYMTKEDCEEYASVVSPPKEVKFYDTDHELNAGARHDRVEWLQKQLGLEKVDWKAIESVPEIK